MSGSKRYLIAIQHYEDDTDETVLPKVSAVIQIDHPSLP